MPRPSQQEDLQPAGVLEQVSALRRSLPGQDLGGLSDTARLGLLHEIELLTRTLAAVSASVQVAFHASQVAAQVQAGVIPSRAGKAVPDDLAAARMCSPHWGSRDLTAAQGLCAHLPRTLQALVTGVISPYQARLVAEGTTCLDPSHRAEIDERLEPRLRGISNRELEAAVRGLVYEVDPAGFVARARKAARDRGVSIRPAPDVMGILTARLPAPQAIAIYQCLDSAARTKRASGDPRSVDQLRADELFERATGRQVVDGVDVEVGLVMTDAALFAGTSDPAELTGHGPVPADYARELLRPRTDESDLAPSSAAPSSGGSQSEVTTVGPSAVGPTTVGPTTVGPTTVGPTTVGPAAGDALPVQGATVAPSCPAGGGCTDSRCTAVHGDPGVGTSDRPRSPRAGAVRRAPDGLAAARVWVRRLYADPVTGVLTGRDPRRRFFTDALRMLVIARDRTCRNPWCGAPIRTVDHIHRHADGGTTDADNGQGLCERCNLARERPRALLPRPLDYLPAPPVLPVFPRPRFPRPRGGDRGDRDGPGAGHPDRPPS